MEIALLPKKALRIKSKIAVLLVNPTDTTNQSNASLFFDRMADTSGSDTGVAITGSGEYEIGGIKISGLKHKEGIVYSLNIDGIDVLVGALPAIDKLQHKLKEHAIVIIQADESIDASFINGLSTNMVIVYGDNAKEVIQKFAKEGTQEVNKVQITKDKLPQEIQTIVLV